MARTMDAIVAQQLGALQLQIAQLQVQVDPKRLHDAGVSLQQVISTTGNSLWVSPLTFLEASSPGTGGFIESQNQRLTVR